MNEKILRCLFNNTIDILSLEEFEKFMDKRSIVGEEDISEKLENFPFKDTLNTTENGDDLRKTPTLMSTVPTTVEKFITKLVKKYGPYYYGECIDTIENGRSIKFIIEFAKCSVEGSIIINEDLCTERIYLDGEKIDKNFALKTNDGVLFQRTPVGVILYDRREESKLTLKDIYERYS